MQFSTRYRPAPSNVLAFPPRGPFAVRIEREQTAWLVICRDHGWLHGDRQAAVEEALELARGYLVSVVVGNRR
jgi:hypothetical protein